MEPIIRVDHLTHTYSAGTPFQRSAVRDMSLEIRRGEFLGIIGHTGSGKSTLIQHLNGLLKPTEGHIYLNGQDIWADPKKIRQVRFQVGLVFQYPEYQLFEETVYKDVAFGPKNMGLPQEEIDRRVRASVRAVGLSDEMLEKSPFALSGGQKRRVAIAGVMAMEPEVLILDEPTAGLDPRGCEDILSLLRAYHARRGSTVVLYTEEGVNAVQITVPSVLGQTAQQAEATLAAAGLNLKRAGVPLQAGTVAVRQSAPAGTTLPAGGTVEAAFYDWSLPED